MLRRSIPKITMSQIHEAFCAARGVKPGDIVEDLTDNCHEVATRFVELVLEKRPDLKARTVYGFYLGKSVRKAAPFHRHGWALIEGKIYDPTRFVFEGKQPYLFVSDPADAPEYDEGMNYVKAQLRPPFPHNVDGKELAFDWPNVTLNFLRQHCDGHDPRTFKPFQLMWVANTPPQQLGKHIHVIYPAIIAKGKECFIPIDNLKMWEASK